MQVNSLSDILNLILIPIRSVLFFHKKKVLFFILSVTVLLIVLFPFSDLTFYAQRKINDAIKPTGSQVTFSELNFSLFPVGIKTEDIHLNVPNYSSINLEKLTISPNLLALLKFQPGGTLTANGLFGGDLVTQFGLIGKTEEQQNRFSIFLSLNQLNISQLFKFLKLPVQLKGQALGELSIQGEESFRQQPEGEFNFNFRNVQLPSEISTDFGTLALPKKVTWSNSLLQGQLEEGRLIVQKGTLGTKTSPINGRYKGVIQTSFSRRGSNVSATWTRYDLKVELELDRAFEQGFAKNLSSFIDPGQINKQNTPGGGARYLFNVVGTKFGPPQLRRLNNF